MITFLGNRSFFGMVYRQNVMYAGSLLYAMDHRITVNRVGLWPVVNRHTFLACFCNDCRAAGHVEVDQGLFGVPNLAENVVLTPEVENISLGLHQLFLVHCWKTLTDCRCTMKRQSVAPHELCTQPRLALNVDQPIPSRCTKAELLSECPCRTPGNLWHVPLPREASVIFCERHASRLLGREKHDAAHCTQNVGPLLRPTLQQDRINSCCRAACMECCPASCSSARRLSLWAMWYVCSSS